mgnify:FL=1|tara:strand:+ start:218 stop:556 length:339 start_codon:yes stop_codon:yes gene_type:complete
MVKINVIDRNGEKKTIEIEEGTTIRDAIEAQIEPENYGVCGGTCRCGTCQVYIDLNDFNKLNQIDNDESRVLKTLAINPKENSRLACQIEIQKKHENITITIAEHSFENLFE